MWIGIEKDSLTCLSRSRPEETFSASSAEFHGQGVQAPDPIDGTRSGRYGIQGNQGFKASLVFLETFSVLKRFLEVDLKPWYPGSEMHSVSEKWRSECNQTSLSSRTDTHVELG